jgi:dihydroorotase-like cyclic amidohydrolase
MPAPAEDKRRPFGEASPGAVGLETLLPAAWASLLNASAFGFSEAAAISA